MFKYSVRAVYIILNFILEIYMNHLPIPNRAQENVIASFRNCPVTVVQATAGSGKSTTCLLCVHSKKEGSYVMLTYSNKLRKGLKEDVEKKYGLTNVEVHTFHSFCVKYIDPSCCRNEGLVNAVRGSFKLKEGYSINGLIIDEIQDMTTLTFSVVQMIKKSNDPSKHANFQYIIVGDKNQGIFRFLGADTRFLTYGHEIFGIGGDYALHELTEVRRYGPKTCDFVNNVLFGGDIVVRPAIGVDYSKEVTPRYVVCDMMSDRPYEIVVDMLERHGFSSVYILAATLKKSHVQNHVATLVNKLMRKYRICVNNDDDMEHGADCELGKVVVSTIHKVKGGERTGVVFFQDSSSEKIVPNEIYVACTRHKHELVIIQDVEKYLPAYIDPVNLARYADVEGIHNIKIRKERIEREKKISKKIVDKTVTDLIRFIPTEVCMEVSDMMPCDCRKVWGRKIAFKSTQVFRENDSLFHEPVSDINGIAIPAMLEAKLTKSCWILKDVLQNMGNNASLHRDRMFELQNRIKEGDPGVIVIGNFLYIANMWLAQTTGYYHRTSQIRSFTWIKKQDADEAIKRLEHDAGLGVPLCEFEVPLSAIVETPSGRMWCIHGRIDAITPDGTIVEVKCTAEYQTEHLLQLQLYAWLLMKNEKYANKIKKLKLFYVCTGESIEYVMDYDKIKDVVFKIVASKDKIGDDHHWCNLYDDGEFLELCRDLTERACVLET